MIYVARNLREELLEFKEGFRRQCGGLPIIATRIISEPTTLNAVTIHLQASRRVGRNQKVILVTEWIVNGTRMGENAMFGRLRKLGTIED